MYKKMLLHKENVLETHSQVGKHIHRTLDIDNILGPYAETSTCNSLREKVDFESQSCFFVFPIVFPKTKAF